MAVAGLIASVISVKTVHSVQVGAAVDASALVQFNVAPPDLGVSSAPSGSGGDPLLSLRVVPPSALPLRAVLDFAADRDAFSGLASTLHSAPGGASLTGPSIAAALDVSRVPDTSFDRIRLRLGSEQLAREGLRGVIGALDRTSRALHAAAIARQKASLESMISADVAGVKSEKQLIERAVAWLDVCAAAGGGGLQEVPGTFNVQTVALAPPNVLMGAIAAFFAGAVLAAIAAAAWFAVRQKWRRAGRPRGFSA